MTELQNTSNDRILTILNGVKNSRQLERSSLGKASIQTLDIRDIGKQVEEVAHYNGKIEDSIKMEILGIKEDFLSRTKYKVLRKIKGETEPAERVINNQIERVATVSSGLVSYADHLDKRTSNLETRYNGILDDLLRRHNENKLLKQEMEGRREVISYAESTSELTLPERIEIAKEQRLNRRAVLTSMHKLKLNDRAASLLREELPVLDALSAIAETYSFTLREIHQESEMLGDHLQSVASIYIDVMRSQRTNLNLGSELSKLFTYTSNMINSLKGGARLIVDRAKDGSLVERNYSSTGRDVGNILGDIENVTFKAFNDLERRLNI